jgi:transcriptional regulator with XRE-family HTH domain
MNERRTLSEQLKRRRQALGLSLSEVARRASTSSATLSRYESNWVRFEVYTLRKLAAALDCELELRFKPKKRRSVPRVGTAELVSRLGRLFWDSKLTVEKAHQHPGWVVERVLEVGNLEDVELLREAMGREAFLKAVASVAERLSAKTRSFWQQILTMEGVTCTKKYSRNTAWNS